MRPLKLEITAFCSYPGKTVIDLEKLGESGIYLITGNTGAGKTTIFDAITYALYGEPSGKDRDPSYLRSKYAPIHVETCVKLTFSHKGKTYIVERKPAQFRAVKEGAVPVDAPAKSNLYEVIGGKETNIASSVKDVTTYITNLLGIDHRQFCQIAMIAQGDFAKILKADSKERQNIFRKLFNTQLYEKMQTIISKRASDSETELKSLSTNIKQNLNKARCDEKSPLYKDFSELLTDGNAYDKIIDIINEIRNSDIVLKNDLENKIEDCNKEINSLNEIITISDTINSSKNELDEAEKSFNQHNELQTKLIEAFENTKKNEAEINKLTKEITKSKLILPNYEKRDTQKKNLESTKQKLENDKGLLTELNSSLNTLDKEAEENNKELAGLKDILAIHTKLVSDKELAELNETRIKELCSLISQHDKLVNEYSKALEKMKLTEANEKLASEEYTLKRTLYLNAQAGILAESLSENKPCPVCGSLHHPALAEKPVGAPTQQELEDAENKLENAKQTHNNASLEASEINIKKNSFNERYTKLMNELKITAENCSPADAAKTALSKIQADIQTLENDISTAKKNIERKEELENILESIANAKKSANEKILELNTEIATGTEKISNLTSEIANLSSGLEHDTLKEAEKSISDNEAKVTALKNEINTAAENLAECKEDISRLDGRIGELKKAIETNTTRLKKKKKTEDNGETDYKSLMSDCENKRKKLSEDKETVSTRIAVNSDVVETAKEQLDDISNLVKKNDVLSKLNRTIGGNLTGQDKITLEAYVQAVYFERIIAHANQRLNTMTNGQYAFKRKQSGANRSAKCGLDLEIVDYFNGSRRDVGSLSGGESFKASLSLALGLADEIQSKTSGVTLDSMFIDEGFGSLDHESLDQAMQALNELSNNNRIIGIISHVDDLKRRIEKKVIVKKTSPANAGASYGTEVTIEV